MHPTRTAVWIAGAFLLAAIIWIVASDQLVAGYAGADASFLGQLQLLKGGIFVVATTLLLFFTIRWILARQARFVFKREELLQDERREIGRVVARTLVHDVRNIMSILQSNIDYLRMQHDEPESVAALDDLDDALGDLNALINQLRESSTTNTELNRINLFDAVRMCGRIVRSDVRFQKITLEDDLEEGAQILAHPVLLRQAILNLFVNAAEAGATHLQVTGVVRDGSVRLEIIDNGQGMSDETMRRAFEPFFSTKNRGSGLGLVSVKQTVDLHGGTVELDHAPGGGLCVELVLPIAAIARSAQA